MKVKARRLDNRKSIVGYPFIEEKNDGSKAFFTIAENSVSDPEFVPVDSGSLCTFCTQIKGVELYQDDKVYVEFSGGRVRKFNVDYGCFILNEQHVLGWYLEEENNGEANCEYEIKSLLDLLYQFDFTKEEEMQA